MLLLQVARGAVAGRDEGGPRQPGGRPRPRHPADGRPVQRSAGRPQRQDLTAPDSVSTQSSCSTEQLLCFTLFLLVCLGDFWRCDGSESFRGSFC